MAPLVTATMSPLPGPGSDYSDDRLRALFLMWHWRTMHSLGEGPYLGGDYDGLGVR